MDNGSGISIWGIFDPAGAYEVVYDRSGLRQEVKTKVAAALEKQVQRGGPRFSLAYTTPTFEEASLSGIQDICGEHAICFGVSGLGPEGGLHMDANSIGEGNHAAVFAMRGGEPYDEASHGCGLAAAFCWPSCFIAGAFSPGGTCGGPSAPRGKVTKILRDRSLMLMQHPPEQFEGASEDRPTPTDPLVVEIDGKPALEVYKSWLSEADLAELERIFEGGNSVPPQHLDEWMVFSGARPIGIPTGQDENGKTVYRQSAAMYVNDGGLQLFGGGVEEGDAIEILSTGTGDEVRERTAATAHCVIEESGFDFDSVQGALSVGCGLFYYQGGADEGIRDLAEKLGQALNWAPQLGVLGGPELGPMGSAKSAHAVYTVGCLAFSSLCPLHPLYPAPRRVRSPCPCAHVHVPMPMCMCPCPCAPVPLPLCRSVASSSPPSQRRRSRSSSPTRRGVCSRRRQSSPGEVVGEGHHPACMCGARADPSFVT